MIRRAAFLAAILLALLPGLARAGVAEDAAAAAVALDEAIAALEEAEAAEDRIAALSATIRAYEQGQLALREGLRQAATRETELLARFTADSEQLSLLLGALGAIDPNSGPFMLLHPAGPLGTVRAGLVMADVAPALQTQVEAVKADLAEIGTLRRLQLAAGETLQRGLDRATAARLALAQAVAARTDLPRRLVDDPEAMRDLIEGAETLDALADSLKPDTEAPPGFADLRGTLPLPAFGRVILNPGETDARGVARPGLTLATRPQALVTSPVTGTIRFIGRMRDYGNVMVLEPGEGYLLILAGMDQLYGAVGDIVARDAPLGLMGGAEAATVPNEAGAGRTETLYLELRQGNRPVDPRDWFAAVL